VRISPEIVHRCEADVFSPAEGSIRQRPLFARSGRLAGVPSPGHAPQGWPRNRRELPISSHTRRTASGKWVGRYVQPRVDRRKRGWIWEQSYNPIVLTKVENRRAPDRGGHGIHWREGGKQAYESVERRHNEAQNSNFYVHRHRQSS
jgi:hypothetical protein